jgi:hypothetical protein
VAVSPGLDIRRIVKYPPEILLQAAVYSLKAGDNSVFSYLGLDVPPPYIAQLYGLSFQSLPGGSFSLDVDGSPDVVKIGDLGSVRGLDYEEEVRVPSCKSIVGRIYSPSEVSVYQMRHKLRVDKANALLKVLFGFTLSEKEKELAEKYGLKREVKTSFLQPIDPYRGCYRVKTISGSLSSSGTLSRIVVPEGWKAVLLDVAAERPSAPGSAYLAVERDETPTLYLDLYCLPGLQYLNRFEHPYALCIPALDWMEISLDVKASGTYRVRAIYGLGELTIQEKVKWCPDKLTDWERDVAESMDLYEKVEAGIA